MSQERKTRVAEEISGNPDQIFTQLETRFAAAQTVEDRSKIADQIVGFACEENYDYVAVLRATKIGYGALAKHGNYDLQLSGARILDGINRYFARQKVTTKILFAEKVKFGLGFRQAHDLTQETRALERKASAQTSVLLLPGLRPATTILTKILSSLQSITSNKSRISEKMTARRMSEKELDELYLSYPIPNFNVSNPNDNLRSAVRVHTEILIMARDTAHKLIDDRLRSAERIVAIASKEDQPAHPDIPNVLETRFADVSLKEIVISDSDVKTAARQAIRYMAALPPGDYFWQKVAFSFFFVATQEANLDYADDFYANPNMAKRILDIQKYISEKLLMPTLGEDIYVDPSYPFFHQLHGEMLKPDPEFDAEMLDLMPNLDPKI